MKSSSLFSPLLALPLLVISSGAGALAQDHQPLHYSGLINDYSPSTVKGGPWEMHGQWTLDLHPVRGHQPRSADFIVDMTMSDYGTTTAGAVDPTQAGQSPHTHHIELTVDTITWNMDGCPTVSPATKTGFQINGTVSLITGNGTIAPFEPTPPATTLQVCIMGGDDVVGSVVNSNITMVFSGPATMHFGTQAIHGVVRRASSDPIEIFLESFE